MTSQACAAAAALLFASLLNSPETVLLYIHMGQAFKLAEWLPRAGTTWHR